MSGNQRGEALEKKWEEIVRGWQGSLLSLDSYTKSHHISKSNFYKWKRRLDSSQKAPPLSFIELQPLAQASQPEVFSVEVGVSKGGCVKVGMTWPKVVELVKALL